LRDSDASVNRWFPNHAPDEMSATIVKVVRTSHGKLRNAAFPGNAFGSDASTAAHRKSTWRITRKSSKPRRAMALHAQARRFDRVKDRDAPSVDDARRAARIVPGMPGS